MNKKKGIAYLKGEARALCRDQTRERLEHNLESLESYCKPGIIPEDGLLVRVAGSSELGYWPSRELLCEIAYDVVVLARLERKRPYLPVWKAFEQVDKRMKKLQLEKRVQDLIDRALAMPTCEAKLWKAVVQATRGNVQAQCSLGEMLTAPKKLYELLLADRRMTTQRCMAQPLADWLITIGHPKNMFEFLAPAEEAAARIKAEQKRASGRERKRKHDLRKKIGRKSVTSA